MFWSTRPPSTPSLWSATVMKKSSLIILIWHRAAILLPVLFLGGFWLWLACCLIFIIVCQIQQWMISILDDIYIWMISMLYLYLIYIYTWWIRAFLFEWRNVQLCHKFSALGNLNELKLLCLKSKISNFVLSFQHWVTLMNFTCSLLVWKAKSRNLSQVIGIDWP